VALFVGNVLVDANRIEPNDNGVMFLPEVSNAKGGE
jgi:hypothetical protein